MEKALLIEKAKEGYTVCYVDNCPLRQQCLRWQVGQHVPNTKCSYWCVNPHFDNVETEQCPMFRPAEKTLWAKGMTRLLADYMPKNVESAVRTELINRYNRTYFFEYRNGTRLIPPAMQEEIRDLFRRHGWTQEVQFDEFVEDYDW